MNHSLNWTQISQLKEPFNDAVNYKSKGDKQFFSSIFLRTDDMKSCLAPSTYYLIGEKGTGKTAYAVFLENNTVDDHRCKLTTMTETQYKRFIELKKQGKLSYSDFANIWRSMLLLIVSQMLVDKSKSFYHSFTGKFSKIENAIEKWNLQALNPEVESAFEVLVSDQIVARLKNENVGEISDDQKKQETEKISIIRHHLLETEGLLKEAIRDLKVSKHHILFVDGIDFRPEGVPYPDYIECIKGLAEAAWQLNTEFFNGIKDSKGRLKIMLLVRPDVFQRLNLYNSNSRLQDNSVLLDWTTTEREYEQSKLFEVGGKFFANQQMVKIEPSLAWNQYFNGHELAGKTFKRLLKSTFQKPRDILTFIKIAIRHQKSAGNGQHFQFAPDILSNPKFTKEYSDYLLGEVKNYASFYMTVMDFSIYLKIFQYLDGKPVFSMLEFETAFQNFSKWVAGEEVKNKEFLRDSESLLQFLYEVNVIGYHEIAGKDKADFYHWAYRERSINNLSPKVKTSGDLILNPGIAKALDIGKEKANKTDQQVLQTTRSAKPRRVRGNRRGSASRRKSDKEHPQKV